MRWLLIALILTAAPAVFGQTRTVDNFALDKFKQQRLAAERDLRENYAKLGFPSPEELARQREKDEEENAELLDKLREERLERERLELERQRIAVEDARNRSAAQPIIIGGGTEYPYYPYVYDVYSRRPRGNRFRRHGRVNGPLIRVTPVGVVNEGYAPRPGRGFARPRPTPRRH